MSEEHSGKLNIVNRNTYLNFQPSPKTKYRSKTRIKRLTINKIDHDKRYEELKARGLTAEITNPEIYVNGKKPMDGIFSPRYGADTTTEAPMYSCDCHKLTGANNQGRICPDCGTVCRTIEADLRTTLYIDIAPYHVLTYHGYKQFCKVFQDKVIQDIIHSTKRINQQGKIIDDGKPTIMDLYDDYEEKYEKKLGLKKCYAFTSKIPVYSARLRPLMQFGVSMTILDVNKKYLSIVRARNILKASPFFHLERKVEIQRTLNQIQQDWLDIFALVEEQLNGKYGAFRKSLASGRVDYSSRMVISLDQTLMPHEIDLPYSTIMVKYEEEIANILCKLDGIDLSHAISLVEENKEIRNEKFVNIINQMLKTGYGKWEVINRPPTISESSLLYCRIRRINKDASDMTMHLPPDILSLLAADDPKRKSALHCEVLEQIQ